MIIIGLTGGIGHGKSTLASNIEHCAEYFTHLEASDVISEVANDLLRSSNGSLPQADDLSSINTWAEPLPDIIANRTLAKADIDSIYLSEQKVQDHPEYFDKLFRYLDAATKDAALAQPNITIETKGNYRTLLQWLGGFLMIAVNEGIWFDELCRRATTQPSENLVTISGIRFPNDAEKVRLIGGTIIEIYRPELDDVDTDDITERQRSEIIPDITVISDSDLLHLNLCAKALHRDLTRGIKACKTAYRCSDY